MADLFARADRPLTTAEVAAAVGEFCGMTPPVSVQTVYTATAHLKRAARLGIVAPQWAPTTRRVTATAELRGITWDHERGRDPLLATAERFERETGIRVTWTARSLQQFADAPIPVLAQSYDLLVLDHPHIGEVVPTGALLPLDELLDGEFIADQARSSVGPSHASYEWEGHLWGLAIDAAGHVSAYRPDLLERLGTAPPETWDDVLELERRARAAGMAISASEQGRGHARLPADAPCQRGHRSVRGRGAARAAGGRAREARAARVG